MATLPHTKTVTYEEWLTMPEVQDGVEEVVSGEIRIMPAPRWNHTEIVEALHYSISTQIDRKLVRVVGSMFGLIIRKNPLTARQPDLAVFNRSTIVEEDGYIHSAPQLVVEVLSPSNTRRERERKLSDYAEIGVPEVWMLSHEAETVEVLYLENDQYIRAYLLGTGDTLKPKLFPNVQVNIAEIWPD